MCAGRVKSELSPLHSMASRRDSYGNIESGTIDSLTSEVEKGVNCSNDKEMAEMESVG